MNLLQKVQCWLKLNKNYLSDNRPDIENTASKEKWEGVSEATNNTFVILEINTTRIHDRKTYLVLNQVI